MRNGLSVELSKLATMLTYGRDARLCNGAIYGGAGARGGAEPGETKFGHVHREELR